MLNMMVIFVCRKTHRLDIDDFDEIDIDELYSDVIHHLKELDELSPSEYVSLMAVALTDEELQSNRQ